MKLCLADALVKLMSTQEFDSINVNAICEQAGIGRTTFYRHFDNKNNKEELLLFKLLYEWERYADTHEADVNADKGFAMMNFIYENRRLFSLLHKHGLIVTIMRVFEEIITEGTEVDKNASYMVSYFTYGYFGIIYQWIKYDFDETPKQIQEHIAGAFASAAKKADKSPNER